MNNVASKARDVYNFGRLIQIITGGQANEAVSAASAEADNQALEKKSLKLRSLRDECLASDLFDRPTMAEILKHHFFTTNPTKLQKA